VVEVGFDVVSEAAGAGAAAEQVDCPAPAAHSASGKLTVSTTAREYPRARLRTNFRDRSSGTYASTGPPSNRPLPCGVACPPLRAIVSRHPMPTAFWKVFVTRRGVTPSISLRPQIQSAARVAASSQERSGSSSGTQAAACRCVVRFSFTMSCLPPRNSRAQF
jgi:hypothetical protein